MLILGAAFCWHLQGAGIDVASLINDTRERSELKIPFLRWTKSQVWGVS